MGSSSLTRVADQQAQAGVHSELITDFSRLEALAPEWERLFTSVSPAGGLFQSWPWTRAFWKVHGRALSLCTPVVFEGATVIGILPVAVSGRTARLLGAPYADYNGVLCALERAAEVVPAALTALLDAPHGWTECIFEGVPASSPLLEDGAHLPSWLRAHRQVVFGYSCPTAVNDGAVFDGLSRKERLRKQDNRLARRGRLCFRHIEDREEILSKELDRFFTMHIARQAMMGVRSQFLSPDARAMVQALVAELDPGRELRFSVLELDGRPLAYHFGLQHAGKYMWYLPTFDVEFWDDSPGVVLLRRALEYAHEQQLAELDFTIGEEEYKSRFANHVRQTFTVHFDRYPRTLQARARRIARGTRDAMRRRPALAKHGRQLRSAFIRAVRRLRYPAAFVRSASRVFGTEHTVICHANQGVRGPVRAHVARLTLSDFALLRLQYPSLDDATMDAGRRRMKQGEALYLASVQSSQYLFWVGSDADASGGGTATDGRAAAIIREGPVLGGSSPRNLARALAALLSTAEFCGDVRIRSRHRRAVYRAAHESGYAVRRPLGRTSPPGPVTLAEPPGTDQPNAGVRARTTQ